VSLQSVKRKISPVDPTLAGVLGVVLGAAITLAGTWWLERRRDNRRLYGVLGLLASELEDNQIRIRDHPNAGEDAWSSLLTLGNWDANKAAFSQLMRDQTLWEGVTKAYRDIFEAVSGRQDPPTVEALDTISRRLVAKREELERSRFG
jgi:hypothetical protein